MNTQNSIRAAIATLLLLIFGQLAFAEVRDNTGLFSEDAVRQANQRIEKMGVPVVIETYSALPDEMVRTYDPLRKDQAFQEFARRRVQQVAPGGVYVIVTTNPNYVNVTEATKNVIRGSDTNAVRNAMVHEFGAKRFDEGLLRGIDAMGYSTGLRSGGGSAAPAGGAVERSPQGRTETSSPQSAPPQGAPRPGGGISLWTIILWGIILFVLFRVVRGFMARRRAQQQQFPGGGNYPPQPGTHDQGTYGQPGVGRGMGGFGTGLGGGLLGGLLGGMLGGHMARRGDAATHDPNAAAGSSGGVFSNEHDQEFASSGGSFGGDAGGGDLGGGGGGGGGDVGGSSGGEF